MLRSGSLVVVLTLLAAGVAHADTPPTVEVAPPPPVYVAPPPVYVAPPGYAPAPVAFLPSIDVNDLEHRGRQKKIAGGVLIGLGVGLVATGIVLSLANVFQTIDCPFNDSGRACTTGRGPLWLGGVITAGVGAPMLLAGIPIHAVGSYQVRKAQRLRVTGFAATPLVSRAGLDGASVNAQLTF